MLWKRGVLNNGRGAYVTDSRYGRHTGGVYPPQGSKHGLGKGLPFDFYVDKMEECNLT